MSSVSNAFLLLHRSIAQRCRNKQSSREWAGSFEDLQCLAGHETLCSSSSHGLFMTFHGTGWWWLMNPPPINRSKSDPKVPEISDMLAIVWQITIHLHIYVYYSIEMRSPFNHQPPVFFLKLLQPECIMLRTPGFLHLVEACHLTETVAAWCLRFQPLWKTWKSGGMIRNPIYWKINNMFQTTNQVVFFFSGWLCVAFGHIQSCHPWQPGL